MWCIFSPGSLRAKYGSSELKNALHGSASFHAAEREIKFMFPNCKQRPEPHSLLTQKRLTTDAPHMLFLCSVNWAPSHKGSQRSVPEQVCKPNSGTWTYWALQEQAPQPLCEYTRSTSEDLHICFIMYFCNLAIYWCLISPFSPFLFSIDVACWLAD